MYAFWIFPKEAFHFLVQIWKEINKIKDIQIILMLFLVIDMYCQGSSSQIKPITQPPALLAGWEASLGTCSR
jgi:hypothetical protein